MLNCRKVWTQIVKMLPGRNNCIRGGEGETRIQEFLGESWSGGGGGRSLEGEGGSAGESSAICLLPSFIHSQNISFFNMFTLEPNPKWHGLIQWYSQCRPPNWCRCHLSSWWCFCPIHTLDTAGGIISAERFFSIENWHPPPWEEERKEMTQRKRHNFHYPAVCVY